MAARHEEKKRTAIAVGLAAQEERRLRREASMATIRAQNQEVRNYAARVRYETRPEVRKDTRDFFQAKRDAAYRTEKMMQEVDRKERDKRTEAFLGRALMLRDDVRSSEEQARSARGKVSARRQAEADTVRQKLEEENKRKKRISDNVKRAIHDHHDAAIQARANPFRREGDSPELDYERGQRMQQSIRESLKARSRAHTVTSPGAVSA